MSAYRIPNQSALDISLVNSASTPSVLSTRSRSPDSFLDETLATSLSEPVHSVNEIPRSILKGSPLNSPKHSPKHSPKSRQSVSFSDSTTSSNSSPRTINSKDNSPRSDKISLDSNETSNSSNGGLSSNSSVANHLSSSVCSPRSSSDLGLESKPSFAGFARKTAFRLFRPSERRKSRTIPHSSTISSPITSSTSTVSSSSGIQLQSESELTTINSDQVGTSLMLTDHQGHLFSAEHYEIYTAVIKQDISALLKYIDRATPNDIDFMLQQDTSPEIIHLLESYQISLTQECKYTYNSDQI